MTPAARHAAAIEVLDAILGGAPAEKALTNWARGSRFAGSKDRAAVRDLVFTGLRRRRSSAWRGGAETGRGIVLGMVREAGTAPDDVFTGLGHAPAPLTETERDGPTGEMPEAVRLDCPDWLFPTLAADLGASCGPILSALRDRAPVHLRVNTLRTSLSGAVKALADDGIETRPVALAPTALEVLSNPRSVARSAAFLDGLVELQDVASQVAALAAGVRPGDRVLDYCAGGGGKTLALAAAQQSGGQGTLIAHDANAGRMADLPARAARAGARVHCVADRSDLGPGTFDVVFVDAPCSGSGAWRRAPDGKWRLTERQLAAVVALQQEVLRAAAEYVRPGGGRLVYATCSLLHQENEAQAAAFSASRSGFVLEGERRVDPTQGGDGFYFATFSR